MRFANRVAVVTGAVQGLGAAIAEAFASELAAVVIVDLDEEKCVARAKAVAENYSVKTLGVGADVTDFASLEKAAAKIKSEFGRINTLVCNAAILLSGPVEEFDAAKWRKVIDVNLVGYFNTVKAMLPLFDMKRNPSIVQINSKSGKKGSARNSAYAASKFGGVGLTQSLALEFAERGLRVNCVCPGNLLSSPLWVDSLFGQYAANQGISEEAVRQKYIDQVPMKRGCEYDDVTGVVLFLASKEAKYMTGQAINVTGGQEMK